MRLFQVLSQVIPDDRHLEHDGGGVDGDVDEGGEDELVVAGLEAVHHEGAEHDREDSLNNGVGNSEAVHGDMNGAFMGAFMNVKQLKYHLS